MKFTWKKYSGHENVDVTIWMLTTTNSHLLIDCNGGSAIIVATYQFRTLSVPLRRFWSIFSSASSSFLSLSYNANHSSSASGSSAYASCVPSSRVWRTFDFQLVIFHLRDFRIRTGGQTEVVRSHFLINVYANYKCWPKKNCFHPHTTKTTSLRRCFCCSVSVIALFSLMLMSGF